MKGKEASIEATAIILDYTIALQKGHEIPIERVKFLENKSIMELNLTTQRNLDIIATNKEKGIVGTLEWVLDSCNTSMGSRLLKRYLKNPSTSRDEIIKRQNDVEFFYSNVLKREEIRLK